MRYVIILLLLTGCNIFGNKEKCGDTMRFIALGDAVNVSVRGSINNTMVVSETSVDLPWESEEHGVKVGDKLTIEGHYPVGPGDMILTFIMEEHKFGGAYNFLNGSEQGGGGEIEFYLNQDIVESACN